MDGGEKWRERVRSEKVIERKRASERWIERQTGRDRKRGIEKKDVKHRM